MDGPTAQGPPEAARAQPPGGLRSGCLERRGLRGSWRPWRGDCRRVGVAVQDAELPPAQPPARHRPRRPAVPAEPAGGEARPHSAAASAGLRRPGVPCSLTWPVPCLPRVSVTSGHVGEHTGSTRRVSGTCSGVWCGWGGESCGYQLQGTALPHLLDGGPVPGPAGDGTGGDLEVQPAPQWGQCSTSGKPGGA